jgi:hypothetical protein
MRSKEDTFVIYIQGRRYTNGAWTDTQVTGTNTNGTFQVKLPQNMKNGTYAVEVRSLYIDYFTGNDIHFVKLYLDTMTQSNGYNNSNQSNNALYGIFDVQQKNNKNVVSFIDVGDRPWTQHVSGIGNLANGLLSVRITLPDETPITMEADKTWILALDFKRVD